MGYALTSKCQVTVPRAIREYLGIGPGKEIDYLRQPDGSVHLVAVPAVAAPAVDVLAKWRGAGVLKLPTDEIMRITRGDDWGR